MCTSLAISLLITQVVWAEPAPSNSKLSMLPTSCVWMDVVGFIAPQPVITERAILVDRGALTVISPALRGRALLNEHWLISASLPFAATFLSQFPELGSTRIGNPSVDGAYVVELGIRTWLSFGGGVALPVASVPETASADSASNAYRLGRAVRGGATSWELAPDRLTLYFPFAVESGTEYLRVGAEMILWHGFDTSGSGSGNGLPALIGVWIRALALPGVSVGARIKMAALDGDDWPKVMPPIGVSFGEESHFNAQISFEPFTELNFGMLFMGLGVLFNVNEPFGIGGKLFVWGGRLSAGILL